MYNYIIFIFISNFIDDFYFSFNYLNKKKKEFIFIFLKINILSYKLFRNLNE